MNKIWFNLTEMTEYLKVSRATMYRWIKADYIPFHRAGKLYKFNREEVDLWLLSR